MEIAHMPAFKVFLDNGKNYVTSMAVGITLDEAWDYFVGHYFEQADNSMARCTHITKVA